MPRLTATSWAKTTACTPDESQKVVEVMSAITTSTPGVRAATMRSWTSSELVTSISAGSTTTTGMVCSA